MACQSRTSPEVTFAACCIELFLLVAVPSHRALGRLSGARQPPCRVRHQALSGGLWIPRAFRLPAFASCAILCPLWTWPALAMGLLNGSRPQRGYHVPHRQDASGELASLRREPGTVSAKPLTFADPYSRKDVSATFVPFCITTLQPRLHLRSTRVRLLLASISVVATYFLCAFTPTTTLSCVDQICTRRIAVFRLDATRESDLLHIRKSLY